MTSTTTANAPLLAIVGPTGSGKTELSIAIAETVDGEIVNADSRQLYRDMAIGTALPGDEQRSRVRHHLFAITPPDSPINVTEYRALAEKAIAGIAARGKLPILTGGSGLYIRAVIEGLAPPAVAPDPELRRRLEVEIEENGPETLYAELVEADPEAAGSIDPRNSRRLIRALEVIRLTGGKFSEQGGAMAPDRSVLKIGLTLDRAALYERVDRRVDRMIEAGLIEETKRLLDAGFDESLPAMTSVGYREITGFLKGEVTLGEAVEKMKQRTHRFIRQQYTWFRLSDPGIAWLDAGDPDLVQCAVTLVRSWRT